MIDGPASSKINSFSRRASFLSLSRSLHATRLRRELGNLLWSLHGEWDCHKRVINIPWLKTNIYIYTYCRFYTTNIHVFEKFNVFKTVLPPLNPQIAGTLMFIPIKYGITGFDPSPFAFIHRRICHCIPIYLIIKCVVFIHLISHLPSGKQT